LVLNDAMIRRINSDHFSTWVAGRNAFFDGWSVDAARKLMGVKGRANLPPLSAPPVTGSLPTSFSWTDKTGAVGPVLNQGMCGSCWAVSAGTTASDRLRILGNNTELSGLYITTCDDYDNGCEGGSIGSAFNMMQYDGLTTATCQPYLTTDGGKIPTCAPADQPCLNFVNTPACVQTCFGNDTAKFSSTLFFASNAYSVSSYAQQIQAEIYKNGPVQAGFSVYADFVHYTSGVYQHTTGDMLGGHAVEIVGWGVENNVPYWYVKNSWTTSWGDNGFFKILRGSDECGIEDDVAGVTPKLP
jgi:cathepsin B